MTGPELQTEVNRFCVIKGRLLKPFATDQDRLMLRSLQGLSLGLNLASTCTSLVFCLAERLGVANNSRPA